MDKYIVCFVLVSLWIKFFTRFVLGRRGVKFPSTAIFAEEVKWTVCSSLAMLIVSLFGAAAITMDLDEADSGLSLIVKVRTDNLYKSLAYSAFVLLGSKFSTAMLIAPWLGFTLKNMVSTQLAILINCFFDFPRKNILAFAIMSAIVLTTLCLQCVWWLTIFNYYNTLLDCDLLLTKGSEKNDVKEKEESNFTKVKTL